MSLDYAQNLPGNWTVHATQSGYMDRDGWLMTMRNFTDHVKSSNGNKIFLFFDGHDSHWDADALDHLHRNGVESFFLQSQNSENDQPNDNGPNACLKSCYNEEKYKWDEKFGSFQYTIPHFNGVITLEPR